jgi:hypothetical protein
MQNQSLQSSGGAKIFDAGRKLSRIYEIGNHSSEKDG